LPLGHIKVITGKVADKHKKERYHLFATQIQNKQIDLSCCIKIIAGQGRHE
ncbi:MAG: hypothetical protein RLZZ519_3028, partial [Bacteroidota bacterium]